LKLSYSEPITSRRYFN